MTQRFYPAILAAAPDGSIGVVFPDLPGCVSGGADAQEASLHAVDALALHIEAMLADGDAIPEPSALGTVPDWLAEDSGTVLGYCMVPVDLPSKAIRLNITMEEALVHRLDAAAAAEGFTRSGYLAQAARERIARVRQVG
jgi:predicted RNase H-like HicB family nuclease